MAVWSSLRDMGLTSLTNIMTIQIGNRCRVVGRKIKFNPHRCDAYLFSLIWDLLFLILQCALEHTSIEEHLFFIQKTARESMLMAFSPLCFRDAVLVLVPQNNHVNVESILSSTGSWVPSWDANELSWADCTLSPQFRSFKWWKLFVKGAVYIRLNT